MLINVPIVASDPRVVSTTSPVSESSSVCTQLAGGQRYRGCLERQSGEVGQGSRRGGRPAAADSTTEGASIRAAGVGTYRVAGLADREDGSVQRVGQHVHQQQLSGVQWRYFGNCAASDGALPRRHCCLTTPITTAALEPSPTIAHARPHAAF